MKRLLLTIIAATLAVCSYAQPRAVGIRSGASGLEADYQHELNIDQFLEGSIGTDFGYDNGRVKSGFKVTGIYNFVWATPAWTDYGSWALYAGPGLTLGYVNDETHFMKEDGINLDIRFNNYGFMLGLCGQVGLEYTFEFPLQLSVDLRPIIGFHVNEKYTYVNPADPTIKYSYKSKAGFYNNGLLSLGPSISVRYCF